MLKSIATVAALSAMIPLAAQAGPLTPITVSIQYDKAMLATDEGASDVLASIKDQATAACTSPAQFGRAASVDKKCRDDIMAKATYSIVKKQQAEGLVTAPAFEQVAVMQVADLGQR